jgi:hypothetical protein
MNSMQREELVVPMVERLQQVIDEESADISIAVAEDSPLIGPQAVVSSLALVSYIVDVEAMVAERWGAEIILVNESALSRKKSPFRTIGTLADYVLELVGLPVEADLAVNA